MAQLFVSGMAHFFVVVSGSKIHERVAHFFIDIYTPISASGNSYFLSLPITSILIIIFIYQIIVIIFIRYIIILKVPIIIFVLHIIGSLTIVLL